MANTKFLELAKRARSGEVVRTTPRRILKLFGASRRGRNVVAMIRKAFGWNGVETIPDFDTVWIDAPIKLVRIETTDEKDEPAKETPEDATGTANEVSKAPDVPPVADPAHRISRLKAASAELVCLNSGATIELAVTLMMQHDVSQLPVMQNNRRVLGMVSWRSICRKLQIGNKCNTVNGCMEKAHEVRATASMFEAVRLLAKHDALLVRDSSGLYTGIITNADIAAQFGDLAEPFLLLGDIESYLRYLIERSFTLDELKAAMDPNDPDRDVTSVNNLSFGEYTRLVEKPENWDRMNLPLDRARVVKTLEAVRQIRNDVMHFDPDPLDDESIKLLRGCSAFLAEVVSLID